MERITNNNKKSLIKIFKIKSKIVKKDIKKNIKEGFNYDLIAEENYKKAILSNIKRNNFENKINIKNTNEVNKKPLIPKYWVSSWLF